MLPQRGAGGARGGLASVALTGEDSESRGAAGVWGPWVGKEGTGRGLPTQSRALGCPCPPPPPQTEAEGPGVGGALTRGGRGLGCRRCGPGVGGFPGAGGWLLRGGPGVGAPGDGACAGSGGHPPWVDRGGWLGTCGKVGSAQRCFQKGLGSRGERERTWGHGSARGRECGAPAASASAELARQRPPCLHAADTRCLTERQQANTCALTHPPLKDGTDSSARACAGGEWVVHAPLHPSVCTEHPPTHPFPLRSTSGEHYVAPAPHPNRPHLPPRAPVSPRRGRGG